MIIIIDNYDSFTYNIVQYLREMAGSDAVRVFRNDAVSIDEIAAISPSGLILSPGPGRPESAGITMDAIHAFTGKVPMLGVCLGHQAIGAAFGAKIIHAKRLMHGKLSDITADGEGVFRGLGATPFKAMRYHSLALEEASLPESLKITARSEDGEIMGVRHVEAAIEGIQFHPESIMTTVGKRILRNFLKTL